VAQQAGRTCAGCNVVTAASLAAASFRPERCSTTRRHSCTALSTTPVTLGCFKGNLFHFRIHYQRRHTGTQAHRHTGTHGLQGLSGGHGVAPSPGTSRRCTYQDGCPRKGGPRTCDIRVPRKPNDKGQMLQCKYPGHKNFVRLTHAHTRTHTHAHTHRTRESAHTHTHTHTCTHSPHTGECTHTHTHTYIHYGHWAPGTVPTHQHAEGTCLFPRVMMDLNPRGERFLQVVHEELLDRGGHPHRCLCLARHFAVVPVAFGIQRPPKRLLRGLHGIVQVMRMTHTAGRLASATLTSPSAQPRTPLAAGQHFGKTPRSPTSNRDATPGRTKSTPSTKMCAARAVRLLPLGCLMQGSA